MNGTTAMCAMTDAVMVSMDGVMQSSLIARRRPLFDVTDGLNQVGTGVVRVVHAFGTPFS